MGESRALRRLVRKITVETLWIYIAKVLTILGSAKAYQIKKKLEEVFQLKVPAITVYTVVYRMSREGLLDVVKSDGEVLYRLTDRGLEEFQKAIKVLEDVIKKLKS